MTFIRRILILRRCRKIGVSVVSQKKINKLILKIENLSSKIDNDIDLSKLKLIVANKDLEGMKKIVKKLSDALNSKE